MATSSEALNLTIACLMMIAKSHQQHAVMQELGNSSRSSGGRFTPPSEQAKDQNDDARDDKEHDHGAIPPVNQHYDGARVIPSQSLHTFAR
jgi:hypothetical protein